MNNQNSLRSLGRLLDNIWNFSDDRKLLCLGIQSLDLIEFLPAVWTSVLSLSPNFDAALTENVVAPIDLGLIFELEVLKANRAWERFNSALNLNWRCKDVLDIETPSHWVSHAWLEKAPLAYDRRVWLRVLLALLINRRFTYLLNGSWLDDLRMRVFMLALFDNGYRLWLLTDLWLSLSIIIEIIFRVFKAINLICVGPKTFLRKWISLRLLHLYRFLLLSPLGSQRPLRLHWFWVFAFRFLDLIDGPFVGPSSSPIQIHLK